MPNHAESCRINDFSTLSKFLLNFYWIPTDEARPAESSQWMVASLKQVHSSQSEAIGSKCGQHTENTKIERSGKYVRSIGGK